MDNLTRSLTEDAFSKPKELISLKLKFFRKIHLYLRSFSRKKIVTNQQKKKRDFHTDLERKYQMLKKKTNKQTQ